MIFLRDSRSGGMVDAHDSGSCLSNEVEVQVLSPAPNSYIIHV